MQGYNTLWLPGTDHAAIATEAKSSCKTKRRRNKRRFRKRRIFK